MKIIISESKFEQGIIRYLDLKYYPDYNWAGDEYYREEVYNHGDIGFYVNDERMYYYIDSRDGKSLMVFMEMSEDLNRLFHNKWVPVVTKWFEGNTGLKVDWTSYYDDEPKAVAIKNI